MVLPKSWEKLKSNRSRFPSSQFRIGPKILLREAFLAKGTTAYPLWEITICWSGEGRHKISFHINNKGAIKFDFHGLFGRPVFDRKFGFDSYDIVVGWASSDYEENLSRPAALILFDRFKIEIFAKILAELKNTVPVHNQVVDAVTKVFELFIPFLVADQLSS